MKKLIFKKQLCIQGLFILLSLCCSTQTLSEDEGAADASLSMIPHRPLLKWEQALQKLESRFELTEEEPAVIVSIPDQELRVVRGEQTLRLYKVSTSKYGPGNRAGSHRTPLGTHRISSKIGQDARFGSIFISRCNTGRTAQIFRDTGDARDDLKTTRILWLDGLEPGINKGEGVDTFRRLIYIHGTPEEGLIGTPASKGCIRMRNGDVIELFEMVQEGTLVEIYN